MESDSADGEVTKTMRRNQTLLIDIKLVRGTKISSIIKNIAASRTMERNITKLIISNLQSLFESLLYVVHVVLVNYDYKLTKP